MYVCVCVFISNMYVRAVECMCVHTNGCVNVCVCVCVCVRALTLNFFNLKSSMLL